MWCPLCYATEGQPTPQTLGLGSRQTLSLDARRRQSQPKCGQRGSRDELPSQWPEAEASCTRRGCSAMALGPRFSRAQEPHDGCVFSRPYSTRRQSFRSMCGVVLPRLVYERQAATAAQLGKGQTLHSEWDVASAADPISTTVCPVLWSPCRTYNGFSTPDFGVRPLN